MQHWTENYMKAGMPEDQKLLNYAVTYITSILGFYAL